MTPPAKRLLRSQLAPLLLARVGSSGGDARELIRRFELPADAATQLDLPMPLDRFRKLADACAAAARDPLIGLHVAQSLTRGQYGAMEFAARSSASLGDALQQLLDFATALNDLTLFTLERTGGRARLTHRIPGEPLCVGQHGNTYSIAGMLVMARALSGRHDVPVRRVWFGHAASPRPRDRDELRAHFGGAPIDYEADGNGVELDDAALDWPIASADPQLASVLRKEVLSKFGGGQTDLVADLKKRIRAALPERGASIQALARTLHLTPRTLQRRLAEEGRTFADLVEDVRRDLARELVGTGRAPLAEIGFQLGYADLPAFTRAFRRWTGTTPARFRKGGS